MPPRAPLTYDPTVRIPAPKLSVFKCLKLCPGNQNQTGDDLQAGMLDRLALGGPTQRRRGRPAQAASNRSKLGRPLCGLTRSEVRQNLLNLRCRMCGLDVVLCGGDLARLVDDEGGTDDPVTFLPYIFFSPKVALGGQYLAVGVGQQRERQSLGVAKLRQLLRLVGGDADDVEPGLAEVVQVIAKIAGLFRAPRVEAAG